MKNKKNDMDSSKKASQIKKTAEKYIQKGDFDNAISEWEKLLSNDMDGSVYNTIGDLHLKKNAKDEAITAFNKSAKLFRKDGMVLQAIAIYKKIINVSPSEVDALIAIADLNAEKGLVVNAIEHYISAAELSYRKNETEIALGLYDKALELTPKNTTLKIKIAEINVKSGFKGNASKIYEETASVFLNSGDDDKAKKYFLMAISLNPENARSLTGLSVIEERNDNLPEALKYAKNALFLTPENHGAAIRFSELASKTGNIDEAVQGISALFDDDHSNIQLINILSTVYIRAGMVEKAWSSVLEAVDDLMNTEEWDGALEMLKLFKETDLVEARQKLARTYKYNGDNETAVTEFIEIARLSRDKGDTSGELQSYREAIDLDPGNIEILGILEELEQSTPVDSEVTVDNMADVDLEDNVQPESLQEPLVIVRNSSWEETTILSTDEETVLKTPDIFEEEKPDDVNLESLREPVAVERTSAGEETAISSAHDEKKPAPDEVTSHASPVSIKEKRCEAEFYELYGFINEAINEYEVLLSLSLDDRDHKEFEAKLLTLKSQLITESEDTTSEIQKDDDDNLVSGTSNSQVASQQEAQEDPETHYELGVAYMEMGLAEDAIRELRVAANDSSKKIKCCKVIAECYMDEGNYLTAIEEFKNLLSELPDDNNELIDIKYELADVYVKNNENSDALKLFSEIQAQDAGYKDVTRKIDLLNNQLTDEILLH